MEVTRNRREYSSRGLVLNISVTYTYQMLKKANVDISQKTLEFPMIVYVIWTDQP